MKIAEARILLANGKQPPVRIDHTKISSVHSGGPNHKVSGIMTGIRGRKILCKPRGHRGVEAYNPSLVELWKSEAIQQGSVDEETLDEISGKTDKSCQFIVIDTGNLTFFGKKKKADSYFTDDLSQANIYRDDQNWRTAKSKASRAAGQVQRGARRSEEYHKKISSINNIKVVSLEELERILIARKEKDEPRKIEQRPIQEPSQIEIVPDVEEPVVITLEADEPKEPEVAKEIEQPQQSVLLNAQRINILEEIVTSPEGSAAFQEFGEAFNAYNDCITSLIEARNRLNDAWQKVGEETFKRMSIADQFESRKT